MRRALLFAAGLTGLAGCASHDAPPRLQQDITYLAEWIGEAPVTGRRPLSLTLSGEARAYGNAGCNHWFANYQLDGDRLRFSDIGSTRRQCSETVMQQERHFLEQLGRIERWDISNIDQLRLWPATGAPLRFWPEQD